MQSEEVEARANWVCKDAALEASLASRYLVAALMAACRPASSASREVPPEGPAVPWSQQVLGISAHRHALPHQSIMKLSGAHVIQGKHLLLDTAMLSQLSFWQQDVRR